MEVSDACHRAFFSATVAFSLAVVGLATVSSVAIFVI